MSKIVKIGSIAIGGNNPIAIQSMTNTKTENALKTTAQIKELAVAGCEIVRVSIPNNKALQAFAEIRKKVKKIPLVADIHFDHSLAIGAVEAGADKIRINPGNIGSHSKVKEVINSCKKHRVPIRVGVNAGSAKKNIVSLASEYIRFFEKEKFKELVISIKSSSVVETINAYEKISKKYNYPLHVGITEAGLLFPGSIKSAVGLGAILSRGIGDTIRVSLTADPVEEIYVAKKILQSLELRNFGPEIISCPTCGRTDINIIKLAKEVERKVSNIKKPLKIAVMGCVVNGPGEARNADFGIAGGKKEGLIFAKGKIIKKVPEKKLLSELLKLLKS
jgi:(E)-4-hydroxy-3-methylbut-2-enyl-diphosphate synthase